MYLRSPSIAFAALCAAFVLLSGAGCTQQPVAPVAKPVSKDATPEESFDQLVGVVREGLELPLDQSGFTIPTATGTSRFKVHNTVTSEFLPPAKEGEPYRGIITVSTQSIYSLRTTVKEDDKNKNEANDSNHNTSLMDESAESGPGFSSFDQGLVTESEEPAAGRKDFETVQRHADKVERKFELVYKNNRWDLVTQIDKKNEASIANAFDRALTLQP